MKDIRRRVGVTSIAAAMALMGVGAGVVAAASPMAAETGIEATAAQAETTGVEADGVGGHADQPGVDVNHDFQGEE